jgi:hypothetical protein
MILEVILSCVALRKLVSMVYYASLFFMKLIVLMHEQVSKNRIMINRNIKKELYCEVLSSSQDRKSKTYIINKKGRYYLKHNQLADDVPLAIIFKVNFAFYSCSCMF